jgi:16S rRNA processing protein RimM
VRLRSFTAEPGAIANYGPLEAEDGRIFRIESMRPAKDHFVARFVGVAERNAAEQLANIKLYVPRERLPAPVEADELYHADLVGLTVVDRAGLRIGTVVAVHNFGAGDLIEVRPDASDKTEFLPFDKATVPEIDLAAGRLVVDQPTAAPESAPNAKRG